MNNCTLQIPSLPAALRTVSADMYLPGQAASKHKGLQFHSDFALRR